MASLPRNSVRVGQAAVRLHEAQAHVAELRRHAVHVAAQDGGEVGVDHRGLAAADELHQRARVVRDGHLGEAGGARQLRHAPLVLRVGVAVHEGDGDGVQTGAAGVFEPAPRPFFVERPHDRAVRADALVHLEHARVGRLRQPDVEREDVRPVLVADAQRVAEAARGHVQRRRPRALQERVGRHRRAHAHVGDELRGDRLVAAQPEQVAHALDGGVLVARGVLREQLARAQAAARRPRHHVGERAAAVDPEAPALGWARRDGAPSHVAQVTTAPCRRSALHGRRSATCAAVTARRQSRAGPRTGCARRGRAATG